MAHSNTGRPRSTAAALIAAGAIVAAATTSMPISPPTSLTAPRISTVAVQLAALPAPVDIAPPTRAAASANAVDIGAILENAVRRVFAGAGAGIVFGFVAAGVLAQNVIYRIPVVGMALAPLITVIAIAGAVVVAPIGAVLGALSLLPRPPIPSPVAGRKATTAPHRTAKAASRPGRQITSVPSAGKASAPQQSSNSARTGAGTARHAVSKRVGQH
ncbi:hypothetical protein [Mycobacterium sp. RTGN5]|uniref:hypothetical protein n=1 Tax=Mycobacterium sp. RTGN5 TaxID=3016522 RepID=UPI0029C724EF|nr:hypothetical protein [Mycobacterium sp. RTGN5]